MPRSSVMRFDTSSEKFVSPVATPSSPGSLRLEIVGSDSSSATKGSSVANIAGKKRLPAKPWPSAGATATSVAARAVAANRLRCRAERPCCLHDQDRNDCGAVRYVRTYRRCDVNHESMEALLQTIVVRRRTELPLHAMRRARMR